ncbi:ribulose-phosphate 3-epimerase [Anaerofustis stercorihominis]|uniref:ribulose-phosphate 3-epimerase n=1 Tax=Anaerofustis stercorihominis TaxID=214853 RepID=UPI001105DE92|nr:hypothetical protein [Anaerofustis stercorihominis]
MKLNPSIASSNTLNIKEELDKLKEWPLLHLDIEDSSFSPNITFGIKTAKLISKYAPEKEIDTHLVVKEPLQFVENLSKLNIKSISCHIEPLLYPLEFINLAKKCKFENIGFALNISTPISYLKPFLNDINYIILMTAEPDNKGVTFYEPVIEKIKEAKEVLPSHVKIWVDGGLSKETIEKIKDLDIDTAVVGRYVFSSENYINALEEYSS